MGIADRLSGVVDARTKSRFQSQANLVRDELIAMDTVTAADLLQVTRDLKRKARAGTPLSELLPVAFANCCAAAHKQVGITYRNTQVVAGAAMHEGMIIDMKTGEGKTLAAVLPAYLNALTGKGVHVATANPYLAERDAEQMGRIYRALGLSCASVLPSHDSHSRKRAYAADVTYGTATEFGFDYLRDHMAYEAAQIVHRPDFHYIIVDEADSVLIDESSTPLIISDPTPTDTDLVSKMARLVADWELGTHYEVDRETWAAWVEDPGYDLANSRLGIDIHSIDNTHYLAPLLNAVKALSLYRSGVEYLVDGDEVLVIDTHTGRTLLGRRYNGGIHQAIEAKEGLTLKPESSARATIAVHNYMRLYDRMAGMTGTTVGLERELRIVYGTDVVRVPTFNAPKRVTPEPRIFGNDDAQRSAIADDVLARVAEGQPVLVGTTTVAESIQIANLLRDRGIDPRILNAATPDQEAATIARAGIPGNVTVATNMAGRGTDILLGGAPEDVGRTVAAFQYEAVTSVGGLCVLGTTLNVSTRVDEQLKGRCARQGDPGISYFYYSLDDERLLDNCPMDVPIVDQPERLPMSYQKYFHAAQQRAAAATAEAREQARKYDDVLDSQRRTAYRQRSQILAGTDIADALWQMVSQTLDDRITAWSTDPDATSHDLWDQTRELWTEVPSYPGPSVGSLRSWIMSMFFSRYDTIREAWTAHASTDGWSLYAQRILLACIDEGWRLHLEQIEGLRDVVQLRAAAGRDVHVEYATEVTALYEEMLILVREMVTKYLFASGTP